MWRFAPCLFWGGDDPSRKGTTPLEHLLIASFRSGPFWGQILLFFLVLGKNNLGKGAPPPLKSPPLHARLRNCGLGVPEFGNKFWEINIEGNEFGGGPPPSFPPPTRPGGLWPRWNLREIFCVSDNKCVVHIHQLVMSGQVFKGHGLLQGSRVTALQCRSHSRVAYSLGFSM